MRMVGIIPARGGSKGVPRKNLQPLAGEPLLAYTARAALGARLLDHVLLSTDDAEIAELGKSLGLHVPFLRPAELARDDTPTLPVLQHAVAFLEAQGDTFDAICLLQPTNPLRTSDDIDRCLARFTESGADCLFTVLRVPEKYNPHWVYLADEQGQLHLSTGESVPLARRQLLPPAFHREGSVYVTRRDVLMQQHSLYGERVMGYEVDPARSVNIDSWSDFARAEAYFTTAAPSQS
jgi:CMP-N-acetylneuraminic acid synthetase